MAPYLTSIVGVFSLVTILLFYLANLHVAQNLSPQGCRMSWMSPSYVLQNGFDSSWSPLARRYSLWLYREVGWDSNQIQGVPVLFIPGNAGSSHQVRSIASSATRQFYSSPQVVAPEFSSGLKPLDFFAGMKCFRCEMFSLCSRATGCTSEMVYLLFLRTEWPASMYTALSTVQNIAISRYKEPIPVLWACANILRSSDFFSCSGI